MVKSDKKHIGVSKPSHISGTTSFSYDTSYLYSNRNTKTRLISDFFQSVSEFVHRDPGRSMNLCQIIHPRQHKVGTITLHQIQLLPCILQMVVIW